MTQIDNINYNEILQEIFQQELRFILKNKIYKTGRFLLFKQNNYHLSLTIQSEKRGMERFEIPIPYSIEVWEDEVDYSIYFDYRLNTLARNDKKLLSLLRGIGRDGNNKFYDSILEIQIL